MSTTITFQGRDTQKTFLDSCKVYVGVPITIVTGLDHLEGVIVSVLTNGAIHPDCVVSAGSITIDYLATVIHVGMPFDSIVQPMRLDSDDQAGNTQGAVKQIRSLDLRLMDTLGGSMANGEVGTDGLNNFYPLQFRSTEDLMDASPPLFTGEISHDIEGNMDNDSTFIIKQSDPLPFTLLSATVKYEVLGAS